MTPYPQPILLRLSEVSDVSANTAHRTAYVTTTLPAIVHALRNLECQDTPFTEFQGPDALFSRLLAAIAGTTEYDAVMGNEVERLNALLAEQVERVETLRRERDEARAAVEAGVKWLDFAANWTSPVPEEHDLRNAFAQAAQKIVITTPTQGAQA